jgi:hypothetical protein
LKLIRKPSHRPDRRRYVSSCASWIGASAASRRFHDYQAAHHEVDAIASFEPDLLIDGRKRHLPQQGMTASLELMSEAHHVSRSSRPGPSARWTARAASTRLLAIASVSADKGA